MVCVSNCDGVCLCVSGPLLGGVVSQWVPAYHELSCIENPDIDGKHTQPLDQHRGIYHK